MSEHPVSGSDQGTGGNAGGGRFFADIPLAARWFGLTGAIPFLGLGVGSAFTSLDHQSYAHYVLVAYGAVILSFLGGVHWGRAITEWLNDPGRRTGLWMALGVSVVPSLIGWLGLLVSSNVALPALAASFAGMLMIDLNAVRASHFPGWYGNLRVILTSIVVASLLFSWL